MKKKNLLLVLSSFAVSVIAMGVLSMNGNVVADAANTTFWLKDGASVRVGTNGNGIRYTFQITEEAYNAYNGYTKFGVLIAPEDYLTAGKELTPANVFGENAIYNWAVQDASGKYTYTEEAGKTQIVNLETKKLDDSTVTINNQTVAVKEFHGSLINILDGYDEATGLETANNLDREFRGVGYVGVSENGVDYTYTFVGDNDNVRSIAYVAQLALEDAESGLTGDQKEWLQENYIDPITDNEISYTQEYYLEQEDGSYVKQTSVTGTATIDDTVTIALQNFDGYAFDNTNVNNVKSGKLYAGGDELTLKAYYKIAKNVKYLDGFMLNHSEATEVNDATNIYTAKTYSYKQASWGYKWAKEWDMSKYSEISFYVKPQSNKFVTIEFGGKVILDTGTADWHKVTIVKQSDGSWVGTGAKGSGTYSTNNLLSGMMRFTLNSSTICFSNVIAKLEPYTELNASLALGYVSFTEVTDTTNTYTSKTYSHKESGWKERWGSDNSITSYKEIKFYIKSVSGAYMTLRVNGTVIVDTNSSDWQEVKFVKQTDGSWFAKGAKGEVTVQSAAKLSAMLKYTLNAGTYYFTNVLVK